MNTYTCHFVSALYGDGVPLHSWITISFAHRLPFIHLLQFTTRPSPLSIFDGYSVSIQKLLDKDMIKGLRVSV